MAPSHPNSTTVTDGEFSATAPALNSLLRWCHWKVGEEWEEAERKGGMGERDLREGRERLRRRWWRREIVRDLCVGFGVERVLRRRTEVENRRGNADVDNILVEAFIFGLDFISGR